MDDRKVIAARWANGERVTDIAKMIGCAYSTVYAELRKGLTGELYPDIFRPAYDPILAQRVTAERNRMRGPHNEEAEKE